jgi:transcriptional regulator with XRE-family HTH domain
MDAGKTLRYARLRAGLTQRSLAKRTGVPQPAIARIESGRISPRVSTLVRLLAATGMALEIAPRVGEGVDRSLIRAALERSPEDRIRAVTDATRNLRTFLDAAR